MKPETIRLSQKQECRIAKRHNGTLNAGSGNGFRKNDVRSEGLLWEMKRTSKTQITIKTKDLEDLRKNALLDDRIPVLHVEIGTRRCVILLEDDFEELLISADPQPPDK